MPWSELEPRKFPAFEKELDGISKQTMEDHYKLYEGYVKKVNECRKILKGFDYAEIEGNQVYSPLRAVSIDYTFALLGFKNHDLYFGHLGGDGGEPGGRFAELIHEELGGVDKWFDAVKKAASAARGWVMVGYDLNDGSLFNYIMDTQNLWAVYNMVPVLALDVYEHAYVRDFGATPGRAQAVRRGVLPQHRLGPRQPPAGAGRGGEEGRGLRRRGGRGLDCLIWGRACAQRPWGRCAPASMPGARLIPCRATRPPARGLGLLAALAHRAPAPVAALGGVEEEPAAALAGALLEARAVLEQGDRGGDRDMAHGGRLGGRPAPSELRIQLAGTVGVSRQPRQPV